MNKFTVFMILICMTVPLAAEDSTPASQKEKPEFTEEQLNKLKAAEEKFKDNPEMMNFINKIKEQSGLTNPPEAVEVAPQKQAIQGSRSVADQAYQSGDYETALEHYQALAAEGDADASLVLGTMYEQGLGTEKDPAKAHAWYKNAADAGDDRGKELMNLADDQVLTDEDKIKAQQEYDEISKSHAGGAESQSYAGQEAGTIIKMNVRSHNRTQYVYTQEQRMVKISPKKFQPTHLQPQTAVGNHYQPERFRRTAPASD